MTSKMWSVLSVVGVMALVLGLAGIAAADVVYEEFFPTEESVIKPLGSAGWEAYWGTTAMAYDTTTNTNTSVGPVVDQPVSRPDDGTRGRFFHNDGVNDGQRHIWFEDGLSLGPFDQLLEMTFYINNRPSPATQRGPTENLRVVVQAGGSWYVSDAVYNFSDSDLAVFQMQTVDFQTDEFLSLAFTAGSTLGLPGALAIPTGNVTAIGFYDNDKQGNIRADTITVTAQDPQDPAAPIAEPASLGLLGLALLGLRKRRS